MATAPTTTTYHLIVDCRPAYRFEILRTTDDYDTLEDLVRAAADYQAGELRGEVVGAYSLTFSGRFLLYPASIDRLGAMIAEDLRARPEWVRNQSIYARQDARRERAS